MIENKSDSARHTIAFQETMKRLIGEIDRMVYSAEIACKVPPECRVLLGRCECPFVPNTEPHVCSLPKIRAIIGDHFEQHDCMVTGECEPKGTKAGD